MINDARLHQFFSYNLNKSTGLNLPSRPLLVVQQATIIRRAALAGGAVLQRSLREHRA